MRWTIISQAVGQMEDEFLLEALERRGAGVAKRTERKQRYYPVRRVIAVAAVIAVTVAALCGVGYAVYQLTLANRVMAEWLDGDGTLYTQYSPVGYGAAEASDGATASEIEMAASGPEFQALSEWTEYSMNRGEDEKGEMVSYEDPIRSTYGYAWSNDVARLREIAEKYGLRLYENVTHTSVLSEFYQLVGLEAFAPLSEGSAETSGCNATVYDDGSFKIRAVRVPVSAESEDRVNVNILRAMKGTFCKFLLLGDEAESYINETYSTEDGVLVELSLGERYSMIFAELDNSYVTIEPNGGTDPGEYLALLDMDDLKYIADSIDFGILAETETPTDP